MHKSAIFANFLSEFNSRTSKGAIKAFQLFSIVHSYCTCKRYKPSNKHCQIDDHPKNKRASLITNGFGILRNKKRTIVCKPKSLVANTFDETKGIARQKFLGGPY